MSLFVGCTSSPRCVCSLADTFGIRLLREGSIARVFNSFVDCRFEFVELLFERGTAVGWCDREKVAQCGFEPARDLW